MDLERLGNNVINHLPVSNIEKLSQVNHYEELIGKMKDQGLEKHGHLQELHELVANLDQLSSELLQTDEVYQTVYKKAKPNIDENMTLAKGTITSEIQICLNGIYGFLLLRLDGTEINPSDQKVIESFGDVLSYLSAKYKEIYHSN
jgi:hypothetical protein